MGRNVTNKDQIYETLLNAFLGPALDRHRDLLVRLLLTGPNSYGASRARSDVLVALCRMNDESVVDLVEPVVSRGVAVCDGKVKLMSDLIGEVFLNDPRNEELIAQVFDACLETDQKAVWTTSRLFLKECTRRKKSGDWLIPDPVLATLQRRALRCPFPGLRLSLLRDGLRRCSSTSAFDSLALEAMKESDSQVVMMAVAAFRRETIDAGRSVPDEALQGLIALLGHASPGVVIPALALLMTGNGSDLTGIVTSLLFHRNPEVRVEAVVRLVELGADGVLEALLPHLQDSSARVRAAVAQALGNLVDERSVSALVEALRDSDRRVRGNAEKALRTIRTYFEQRRRWKSENLTLTDEPISTTEALLRQTTKTETREIRIAAIHSLGTLGCPEALPFLIELMKDADSEVASAARETVERINRAARSPRPEGGLETDG